MVKTSDYILKFHEDFYTPIREDIKTATTRADSKPLDIGDFVIATFLPSDKLLLLKIDGHYAMRLKDLDLHDAKQEGYLHEDLLKHELKTIYPDLKPDDYVYIYRFTRIREQRSSLEMFRSRYKFTDNQWISGNKELK